MEVNFKGLGAEELSAFRKPQNKDLPSHGFKEYAPDGSWSQEKRIEKALENVKEVISEPKVNTLGSLIHGEYHPENNLVEITKGKGPFWQYMGYTENTRDYILPEEALYLLDLGSLEVYHGDVPLSIQQAYGKLLGNLSLGEYQVYAHLMHQGYIVTRFDPKKESMLTRYEQKIGLHHHLSKQRRKQMKKVAKRNMAEADEQTRKRLKNNHDFEQPDTSRKRPCERTDEMHPRNEVNSSDSDQLHSNDSVVAMEIESVAMETTPSVAKESGAPVETCDYKSDSRTNSVNKCDEFSEIYSGIMMLPEQFRGGTVDDSSDCSGGRELKLSVPSDKISKQEPAVFNSPALPENAARYSAEWSRRLPYSNWSFSEVSFLCLSDRASDFDKPDPKLLPESVNLEKCSFHLTRFSLPPPLGHGIGESSNGDLEFSCMSGNRTAGGKSSARNWCEYKQEILKKSAQDDDSRKVLVAHLWEEDVQPLVQPKDAVSPAAVLERLQVIKSHQWTSEERDLKSEDLKITFNLYYPDMRTNFRKSSPPLPNFRVCVLRPGSSPPDLAMIADVTHQTKDDVPILWAMADHGEIQFFTFSPVEIPLDIIGT